MDAPKDVQLTYNDDKLDLNVEYRIELNNRMKKLIQEINIGRVDTSKSTYTIYCTIKYWTDKVKHLVIIDSESTRIGKGGANTLTTTLRSVSSINADGTFYGNPDEEAVSYWKKSVNQVFIEAGKPAPFDDSYST